MKKLFIHFWALAMLTLSSFSVFAATPTITGFTPATGPVGTIVTVTGKAFGNPSAFTIGGVSAIVISHTATKVVGMVMPGATTGIVSLTNPNGTATSVTNFSVTSDVFPGGQQGAKFSGSGAVNTSGGAMQGYAVAISADGKTAIVGGNEDNSLIGAAWIFTWSGTSWTQQGSKLVPSDAFANSRFGYSVALSADGNTAVIGGIWDNNYAGATWIFVRTGTSWAQQGLKLVGTGAVGATVEQGNSVSISANGNTVLVGGPYDKDGFGAAWVFTRNGITWKQDGKKLVGSGAVNTPGAHQGSAVSLSADGSTALVGGAYDNSGAGAAWIFTRTGNVWTPQGNKLVGTGATGAAHQGSAVSLSADGNTALIGGPLNNSNAGAAWVFLRSSGAWSQQSMLFGNGATGMLSRVFRLRFRPMAILPW